MASGEAEAVPDPPKSKTVVLKVFIHCPGCKKKVQKIVKRINGVSTCEVDALHNKVTVTGNVDADSLIKKLLKSGKQADLWPEPKKQEEPPPTTTTAPQKKEKEPDTPTKETSEKSDKTTPKELADSTKKATKEPPEPNDEPKKIAKEDDPKPNKSKPESSSSGAKKEKKAQNAESADKRQADSIPPTPDVLIHQMYLQPPPPTPPALVSYNTVQPTTSHAYYTAAPMPHMSQAYAAAALMPHTSQGYAAAPYYNYPAPSEDLYYGPPGSRLSSPPPPPEDQYEYAVFNDENANSCNVM